MAPVACPCSCHKPRNMHVQGLAPCFSENLKKGFPTIKSVGLWVMKYDTALS